MKSNWSLSQKLREKLWFKIFTNVGIIFVVSLLVISLTNAALMVDFYGRKQKRLLAEQINVVDSINIKDVAATTQKLAEISDKYNFEIEIYAANGTIIYTTYGNQMMDFFVHGKYSFEMQHEMLISIESEKLDDGIVFEHARQRFGSKEFLLCTKEIEDNIYAELRIQKELITSSAAIANEFITVTAIICFILSIIWVFWFARRFSMPIANMSSITKAMSALDFSRKLEVDSDDEIGQLAVSINEMSDSLSKALTELKSANARLKDEIETERQLDAMRRGFVANVSHELKTPIAIISGYAEGLKLNINNDAKEEYCNVIIDESRRMNELVLSILNLSKYESGQIPLNLSEFDVCGLVSPMLERIFSTRPVHLENNIESGISVYADMMQTEQALRAYLENAAAHTPDGGVVRVTAEQKEKTVRISVYNSGSHVEEEQMSQIWQSFYRGDTSHKRESGRFGLGLSIVSAICRQHGTSCGVYNTEDGVSFWIEMPKKK